MGGSVMLDSDWQGLDSKFSQSLAQAELLCRAIDKIRKGRISFATKTDGGMVG